MKVRIKEARERANLTQDQLASKLNVSNTTLSGYETGKHDPKSDKLVAIAVICETSIDYLLGLTDDPTPARKRHDQVQLSEKMVEFAKGYLELDEHGKRMVKFAIDEESSRCESEKLKMKVMNNKQYQKVISLPVYDEPSAAGFPLDAGSHYERLDFMEDVVRDADFGVRISGRSMEPIIPDGCIAFVKREMYATNNDIVIAHTEEGMVCKRAIYNGDRLLYLKSENKEYPDIYGDALLGMTIVGVVVGHTNGK